MRLRPRFTVTSSRPAWVQVLRGLGFFLVMTVVAIGALVGALAVKGRWDLRQEQRAWHSELAHKGLHESCGHGVNARCAQAAANLAGTEIAYVTDPSEFSILWTSTGNTRYKAYENSANGELWTAPASTIPGSRWVLYKAVRLDGVDVAVWRLTYVPCTCRASAAGATSSRTTPQPELSSEFAAIWRHGTQQYELSTFDRDPVAFLRKVFPKVRYATPQAG